MPVHEKLVTETNEENTSRESSQIMNLKFQQFQPVKNPYQKEKLLQVKVYPFDACFPKDYKGLSKTTKSTSQMM